ncbi:MAG: sensor histidine kinase [Lachnospiraceae bacterium]|jgi:two-component system LytT family sensor kinase|nr:sensor histidine kinase [Lachnospiraceae bacterium]MCI8960613.1 sensor histidine kinase [Lachnospiraceae bacterium]
MAERRKPKTMRGKVLAFLGIMIALFVASNLYSINRGKRFERSFDEVLTRYHTINEFQMSYTRNMELYERFRQDDCEENWLAYVNNDLVVRRLLYRLLLKAEELPLEDYLRVQSVKNIYVTYDQILSRTDWNGQEAEQMQKLYELSEIMHRNIQELFRISMTYGVQTHQKILRDTYVGQYTSVSLVIFVAAIAMIFLGFMVEQVLDPIQELSRAVQRIQQEEFDIPDLPVLAEDEIGQLNRSFNQMKKRMSRVICELKEKQLLSEKVHEQELRIMNHEKLLEKTRLSLLQSRINPHFLFNTLNVISGMANMEQARTTNELILCLSRIFRYNLDNRSGLVKLSQELTVIKSYVFIEKKRFGERLVYRLRADADLEAYKIPPFTLQPFIENSIKHGILKKEKGGIVAIRICVRKGWLIIKILDNGVGMEPGRREAILGSIGAAEPGGEISGIGMYNVFSRLRLLYPDCQLKILTRKNKGTCIEIRVREEDCIHDPSTDC